jgi:nitroimidazol reductase NimA-like FMN-containing flavoprotein (pyridoxamine 5'-phosphate oxidase superfamily)
LSERGGQEEQLPALLAAFEAAAQTRDDAGLRRVAEAADVLRSRLLEHPEADAARDASEALWFEHAFLTAELEGLAEEGRRLLDAAARDEVEGAQAAAAGFTRSLARIGAVLEVRALRAPAAGATPAGAAPAEGSAPVSARPALGSPERPTNSHGTRVMDGDEVEALLKRNNWGVLATTLDGVPYGVPIIYGWDGADIYFVTGPGRKAEFMSANPAVTLTITEVEDGGVRWRSVIVHGEAQTLTGVGERLRALGALRRQRPGLKRRSAKDAARLARARFIRIQASEITGRALGY